ITIYAFTELLFICILYGSTSVFRPQSWGDIRHVSMTHKPHPSCLNTPIDFRLFYNSLVSPEKHTAPMFLHVLTQVTHIRLSLFFAQEMTHACQLPAPTLPVHLLSLSPASIRVVASLNTFLV
ncbi:unnamed protein product, partial [Hymenolepis diminuta]